MSYWLHRNDVPKRPCDNDHNNSHDNHSSPYNSCCCNNCTPSRDHPGPCSNHPRIGCYDSSPGYNRCACRDNTSTCNHSSDDHCRTTCNDL